jgi:diguanylate cyclase (GGDEF)-like protein
MVEQQNNLSTEPLSQGSTKARILLIEDDQSQQLLCLHSLRSSGFGFAIETASTGREAIALLKSVETPFDIILLDHGLPDCTGLEILAQIKEISPNTPVVMITGYDNDEFAVMSLRAGASDYLAKTTDYYTNLPRVIQTNLERQRLREEVHGYQKRLTEKVSELEAATEQLRRANSLLNEAHRKKLEEFSGLQQIYRVFNNVTDLKKVCKQLTESTAQLLGAERCALALYDDRTSEVIAQTPHYGSTAIDIPKNRFNIEKGSAAAQIIKTRQPFLKNDLTNDPYYKTRTDALYSLLTVPLKRYRHITGFIYAINKPGGFTGEDVRILSIIANQASIAVENAKLFEQLRHLATTDELSGLANRRHFIDNLEIEIRRSQRSGRPFTLLLIDLDHLKQINDKFGHQVGDAAIIHVAEVLLNNARAIDVAARLGGDEFALLLPETGKHRGQMVADRICRSISGNPVETAERITISAGYSTYPYDGDNAKELLRHADEALYIAKKGGRNQAVAYRHNADAA